MSQQRKVLYLLLALAIVFFTPLWGLYVKEGHIPPDFFDFPATVPAKKAGTNTVAIVITSLFWLAYLLLLFFPGVYGFRKAPRKTYAVPKVKLPAWFFIGGFLWAAIMAVFIFKISYPKALVDWALVPLWWGFILMLDGIVYKRSGGQSLVKNAPTELIAMGVLSVSGWLIFEYFNFFIDLNWYYPYADLIEHHNTFILYAMVGSSAFIPMAFEWYHFLRTFPRLNVQYKYGPRRSASLVTKIILLIISLIAMFLASFYPNQLFYSIWLAPLIVLVIALSLLGIWTPFTPIKEKGDWSALVLFSVTWLLQGICVEWWNHLSYKHAFVGPTSNPGYWEYCLPYVHFGKVFNMPVLGYLGYVPFSIYCFIWFIAIAYLMDINRSFSLGKQFQ